MLTAVKDTDSAVRFGSTGRATCQIRTVRPSAVPLTWYRVEALTERRRPLVVFTPKSMLRLKEATSGLTDFTGGSFRPVLPDGAVDDAEVRRVLLCSGKVFYDLDAYRRNAGLRDTAIVRLERLYSFPDAELAAGLARFPRDTEVR